MASVVMLTAGAVGITACGEQGPTVELGATHVVSGATGVGAAPMVAVSSEGREASAWISAPAGGTDGRLYVSVDGATPAELVDSLGPIEAHAEAPPKLAYAPDGSLHALYVVSKVVPGRRFPLSALRHVRSTDGGAAWSAPETVTDDGDFGSHNFHALHVAADGRLFVSWLDGRAGKSGAYIASSADGGATWSANHRVSVEEACPCCRTAIATDSAGVVYLAWRTVLPGNIRDIVVARSVDGGATWNTPQRVHGDDWQYDGCPHAGPSLMVDAEHRVHIAWWTGKPGNAGVFYARSDDGVSFAPPVTMASAPTSRPSHVQMAVRDSLIIVVWDDGFTPRPAIKMRTSPNAGGRFGPVTLVSDADQVAAFPVVSFVTGGVRVMWAQDTPAGHDHAAVTAPDMRDPKAVKGLTPVGTGQVVARELIVR
jgi:hypothetical protein